MEQLHGGNNVKPGSSPGQVIGHGVGGSFAGGVSRLSCLNWTVDAVKRLGLTTDIETAGQILGIGRTKAYEMARTGTFPVRVIRVGRRYRVATQAILNLLGQGVESVVEPSQVGN